MDLIELVVWLLQIGFLIFAIVFIARIIRDKDKSKVLHQISDRTFLLTSGDVESNKLTFGKKKIDLENAEVYNLRTWLGFKPFYVTSFRNNRPLKINPTGITTEPMDPEMIEELGNLESLKQLMTSKGSKTAGMNKIAIVFSVMAFVIGLLLGRLSGMI